jgi:anti-anti-sigma factor
VLTDILKLLLAKETRDALSEAYRALRGSPEWKAQILTLEEKFTATERGHASLLIAFFKKVLEGKGWPATRAGLMEVALEEIVENAFTHGCPANGDLSDRRISIRAVLTPAWIEFRITDDGPGFDLQQTLAAQRRAPVHERRGLAYVASLVDTLSQDGSNTIVVRMHPKPGQIQLDRQSEIVLFVLSGRLDHEASGRLDATLRAEALPAGARVGIDLAEVDYIGSGALGTLHRFNRALRANGGRCVLIQPNPLVTQILEIGKHDFPIALNREQALAMLATQP